MQVHRFGIAERQDKPCALAQRGQIAPKM
jgi:hypothetical protein